MMGGMAPSVIVGYMAGWLDGGPKCVEYETELLLLPSNTLDQVMPCIINSMEPDRSSSQYCYLRMQQLKLSPK